MKKLLLLATLPYLMACQNKTDYPKLIDKAANYSDSDYAKEHFQDFQVYEDVTTKNTKLPAAPKTNKEIYPWDSSSSKDRVEKTFSEIEKSITAESGIVLSTETSSDVLSFTMLVSNYYSPKQLDEFKKTGSITTENSILDNLKAEIKSYELVNEKNEKIKLNQEVLGINIGGFEEKNGQLLEWIAFKTLGMQGKFTTLKGFVEIEISLPTEYDKLEITKKNIGHKLSIGDQKIQILEFDANVLHYLLLTGKSSDFSYKIIGSKSSQALEIPESVYDKFRQNQGLDFASFEKKYKEFGLENAQNSNEKNSVVVIKNDDFQLDKVFFYKAKDAGIIKKTIKVPVSITELPRP